MRWQQIQQETSYLYGQGLLRAFGVCQPYGGDGEALCIFSRSTDRKRKLSLSPYRASGQVEKSPGLDG